MSLPKVIVYTAVATAIGVGAGMIGQDHLKPHEPAPSTPSVSKPAGAVEVLPDFSFPDLQGVQRSNVQWAGDYLLLYFWATWCKPCTLDLLALADLQRARAAQGLRVAAVAIDDPQAVRAYASRREPPYPILLGGEPAIHLMRDLGDRFQTLPYTALFDPHGRLIYRRPGPLSLEDIKRRLPAAPAPENPPNP